MRAEGVRRIRDAHARGMWIWIWVIGATTITITMRLDGHYKKSGASSASSVGCWTLLPSVQSFVPPTHVLHVHAHMHNLHPKKEFQFQTRLQHLFYQQEGRSLTSTCRSSTALRLAQKNQDGGDRGNNKNNNANDPWANETPDEREQRMRLVRQIQQVYYQSSSDHDAPSSSSSSSTPFSSKVGDDSPLPDEHLPNMTDDDDDDDKENMEGGRGGPKKKMLYHIPLFRVQWTELPGFQNVLNIHVPHYTHMFRCVMQGPRPWYFGHMYLPDGSVNLSNPTYDLTDSTSQATRMGTLMLISDVLERPDGTLALIVQAIDRLQVIEATQVAPYTAATVQLVPDDDTCSSDDDDDDDDDDNNYDTTKDDDDDDWKEFEVLPITWNDMRLEDGTNAVGGVSPLINFNSHYFPDELQLVQQAKEGDVGDRDDDDDEEEKEEIDLITLEYNLWIVIDDMIRLLSEATGGGQVPVPSQLLGLLLPPRCLKKKKRAMANTTSKKEEELGDWPNQFQLERIAQQLVQRNAVIGTGTKSPFVRVPDAYPTLRRARRLSFGIWILLDSLLPLIGDGGGGTEEDRSTRQRVLEMTSIADRLTYAHEKVELINRRLGKP